MGKKKKAEPEKKQEQALTPVAAKMPEKYEARVGKSRDLFKIEKSNGEKGDIGLRANLKDDLSGSDALGEYQSQLYATTGIISSEEAIQFIGLAANALLSNPTDAKGTVAYMNRIASMMRSLEPKDTIEAQLISQLLVLHEQGLYWMGKAMRTDRVDFSNTYINAATKLINRYHETLKALMRYRQGGDQKIIVENVNVNNGGQAIVGNVTRGGPIPQNQGSTP